MKYSEARSKCHHQDSQNRHCNRDDTISVKSPQLLRDRDKRMWRYMRADTSSGRHYKRAWLYKIIPALLCDKESLIPVSHGGLWSERAPAWECGWVHSLFLISSAKFVKLPTEAAKPLVAQTRAAKPPMTLWLLVSAANFVFRFNFWLKISTLIYSGFWNISKSFQNQVIL